jgi:hypothetical protein
MIKPQKYHSSLTSTYVNFGLLRAGGAGVPPPLPLPHCHCRGPGQVNLMPADAEPAARAAC